MPPRPSERYAQESRAELRREVFDYIEIFYNATRRHSTLNMLSPATYEMIRSDQQSSKDKND